MEKTISLTSSSTVAAVDHQTSAQIDGESVILDLEQGAYFGLNTVGARVWELLQEPITVGQIVDAVTSEYEVDRDQCVDDVLRLLQDLNDHDLIYVD